MLAQEIIRAKRDGRALDRAAIDAFVGGLVDGSWSEAQAAALAMAIFLKGMDDAETVALTEAMTASGERLQWRAAELPGPVLDKHSTGGVGDKTSLAVAPIVAACGGFVPMISGRGLGHTGGTLDKLESIAGYRTGASASELARVLRSVGCAIVGQTAALAPADRRLYAIRDVTATVESVPLIVASILSKKLAAGVQGLVMDVKVGNGAFAATLPMAQSLARALVSVAGGAGLPVVARLTDMNQVLGRSCGNALEVHEAIGLLRGDAAVEPRLLRLTRELAAEMLLLGGLAADAEAARIRVDAAIRSGAALERFARMVSALGGSTACIDRPGGGLATAAVRLDVTAPRDGWLSGMATRAIGLAVVELGGGRRRGDDAIDASVGFDHVAGLGERFAAGDRLAVVHAASERAAATAAAAFLASLTWADEAPQLAEADVMIERIDTSGR